MLFLNRHHTENAVRVSNLLLAWRLENPFNPSHCRIGDDEILTIRARGAKHATRFSSFLIHQNPAKNQSSILNLTDELAPLALGYIADPKLFAVGREIWTTFNTGHTAGPNRLFVMRVFPSRGSPVECRYPRRQPIEKNWAFFRRDDSWFSLYSCNPLRILKARGAIDSGVMEFEDCFPREAPAPSVPRWSIGTPLCFVEGKGRFIVHEKLRFLRRKIYLGRAAELAIGRDHADIRVSSRRLAHSWLSLLGSRIKHNPSLISCTYFSGLSRDGDEMLMLYGINDVGFGAATMPWDALW